MEKKLIVPFVSFIISFALLYLPEINLVVISDAIRDYIFVLIKNIAFIILLISVINIFMVLLKELKK